MKKKKIRDGINKMDENEKKKKKYLPLEKPNRNLEIKENYKKRSIKKILSPKIRKTWLTLKYDQQCNTV